MTEKASGRRTSVEQPSRSSTFSISSARTASELQRKGSIGLTAPSPPAKPPQPTDTLARPLRQVIVRCVGATKTACCRFPTLPAQKGFLRLRASGVKKQNCSCRLWPEVSPLTFAITAATEIRSPDPAFWISPAPQDRRTPSSPPSRGFRMQGLGP